MKDERPVGLVIVAHPDDEVLWCGGWILKHPRWNWHILSLCRGSDPDRAPRFGAAAARFGAVGVIGDLDDGPDQSPCSDIDIDTLATHLLAGLRRVDLLLTHGAHGEYTRHLRHEECHRSVVRLVRSGVLEPQRFWSFAYSDSGGRQCPAPAQDADRRIRLRRRIWNEKRLLLSEVYGFAPESWEARCASRTEAFVTTEVSE